jgi:hypothetical protein
MFVHIMVDRQNGMKLCCPLSNILVVRPGETQTSLANDLVTCCNSRALNILKVRVGDVIAMKGRLTLWIQQGDNAT